MLWWWLKFFMIFFRGEGGLVIWFWDSVCDLVLSLFLFVILVVGG